MVGGLGEEGGGEWEGRGWGGGGGDRKRKRTCGWTRPVTPTRKISVPEWVWGGGVGGWVGGPWWCGLCDYEDVSDHVKCNTN